MCMSRICYSSKFMMRFSQCKSVWTYPAWCSSFSRVATHHRAYRKRGSLLLSSFPSIIFLRVMDPQLSIIMAWYDGNTIMRRGAPACPYNISSMAASCINKCVLLNCLVHILFFIFTFFIITISGSLGYHTRDTWPYQPLPTVFAFST